MKILVLSYVSLSMNTNCGKTLLSLLSDFDKNEIINFYVTPNHPDKMYCSSYFYMPENELLKKNHGYVIKNNNEIIKSGRSKLYNKSNKFRNLKLLCRDLMWNISKWNTDIFRDWIINEKPDCILTCTGDSCFLYKIAISISNEFDLPLISHFDDDYYHIKCRKIGMKSIRLFFLRKYIKKLIDKSSHVITLNDFFTNKYIETFNLSSKKITSIYNSSNFKNFKAKKIDLNAIQLSYIGNTSLGREKNLIDIGHALDSINEKYNVSHKLNIYGPVSNDFIISIKTIDSIKYYGVIPGIEVENVINTSDILIHTESFEKKYIDETRYSLSTKIADSLNSGKCLLSYGPDNIASMRHLIENKCSFVISSPDYLESKLIELLFSIDTINFYCFEGKKVSKKFHNKDTNGKKFRNIVNNIKGVD